jgi:hypothetical protein
MIAVPVNVLVMEATRYRVVGSGARRSAASANPMPPNHANPSSWITPTAAPGRRFCPTNEAAVASSSSATPSTGSGIVPSFGPRLYCRRTGPYPRPLPVLITAGDIEQVRYRKLQPMARSSRVVNGRPTTA